MPEPFDRRVIDLSSARAKTNELIRKHVHTRGFVLVYTCITTGQYKTRAVACSLQFAFYI